MNLRLVFAVLLMLTVFGGSVARATPVTYYFGGTLTSASGTLAPLLDTEFSGVLFYDPAWPYHGSPGGMQDYSMPAGAISVSLMSGVVVSDAAASGATVVNWPGDSFDYVLLSATSSSPTATSIHLYFRGPTGTISGLDLPPSLADLNTWDTEYFSVGYVSGSAFGNVSGSLTRLTTDAQPVPDPGSTLLLFGTGLAGLGAWRRRWQ